MIDYTKQDASAEFSGLTFAIVGNAECRDYRNPFAIAE